MNCRHCGSALDQKFVDLGYAPPSNAYLTTDALSRPEMHFPLRVHVCTTCWLVQTEDYADAGELFSPDYAYFSSTSRSWLDHAARYCADVTRRFSLGPSSFVVEVASNDGYLLRNFVEAGVPCLGVEPSSSTAAASRERGVPVIEEFFGEKLAKRLEGQGRAADLIVGNNVFAHVPDVNDFARGMAALLKQEGVVTLEFPHLLNLLQYNQFDTIYHEHFSYLSLASVSRILGAAGLRIWRVERIATHGGSLRVFASHREAGHASESSVQELRRLEESAGLERVETYKGFQLRAEQVRDDLLLFLLEQKRLGRRVAAYGAAAKGNTLLNFAGIKSDLLSYVCDAAAAKQGKFMPGSHIPIVPPAHLRKDPPDYVLVLPWNLIDEIRGELGKVDELAHVKYVTAIPGLRIS
jgi:hypothetical protein